MSFKTRRCEQCDEQKLVQDVELVPLNTENDHPGLGSVPEQRAYLCRTCREAEGIE